jgi:hypothetical protein
LFIRREIPLIKRDVSSSLLDRRDASRRALGILINGAAHPTLDCATVRSAPVSRWRYSLSSLSHRSVTPQRQVFQNTFSTFSGF